MTTERLNLVSSPRQLPSPFLGTLVGLALCGFVPILLMTATPNAVLVAWPLALASTVISGARFAWAISGTSRRLYEMTTWLFLYLFLGLAPLVQLRQGLDPSTTPNIFHQYDVTALSIVIAFEVALIFGSFLARRRDVSAGDFPRLSTRPVHSPRLLVATVVLLALSVFYIVRVGPSSIWASRVDRGVASAEGIGDDVLNTILTALVTLGLLVAVVALAQHRRERRARGQKAGLLLILIGAIVLLFLVNPIGSPRFVLVTVYLGLLAAMRVFRMVRSFRWISLGSIAAMFLIFPILDTFRFSTTNSAQLADPVTSLGRGDYDSYAQIVNTAWYVDLGGITWGNQLLGVLLFWVPRGLWLAKPEDTGIFLAGERGYLFGNLSAPLPAELFINFGWVGVGIGGMLLGMLIRRLDASSEMQLRAIGTPTILGSIVPFYMILLLRGSLLQAAANLAVMLLVWWFVTSASPTRGQEQMPGRTVPTFRHERSGVPRP